MTKVRTALASGAFAAILTAMASAATASEPVPSNFGCVGLERDAELPALEGRDGVFYRIVSDIRLARRMSDQAAQELGALSRALAARGTTLIFAPVPTKAASMPAWLPERAALLGYDHAVATEVRTDILRRLDAVGVQTVDLGAALLGGAPGERTFFRVDYHWNAHGADLAAQAIADVIRAHPAYGTLETTVYETRETGEATPYDGMRQILQARCAEALPVPSTMTYETVAVSDAPLDIGLGDGAAALDIGLGDATPALDIGLQDAPLDIGLGDGDAAPLDLFGEQAAGPQVAIVGTSFTDLAVANFPGFLAQHSQLEVVNYAITGGETFGAITSYLTSKDFQEAPPTFLVWELPIYSNLAQVGDQPMRELIAAAGGNCDRMIPFAVAETGGALVAQLEGHYGPEDTLFLDTDTNTAQTVAFHFWNAEDRMRSRSIRRTNRMRRSGMFYMPLTGLWPEGATEVEIAASVPFGPDATVLVCTSNPS